MGPVLANSSDPSIGLVLAGCLGNSSPFRAADHRDWLTVRFDCDNVMAGNQIEDNRTFLLGNVLFRPKARLQEPHSA